MCKRYRLKKRFSPFIKPLQLLIDILIIIGTIYFIPDSNYLNATFLIYISFFWIVSTALTGFYKTYRFTTIFRIFTLLIKQSLLFVLGYFTYFGILSEGIVINNQALILYTIIISVSIFKFISFYILQKYRSLGKNFRTVVVLGQDDTSKSIIKLFKNKKSLGYKYIGFFSNTKEGKKEYLGKINDSIDYIIENQIDEVYCSLVDLNKEEVKQIKKLANQKSIVIKLIPNSSELYSKNQSVEFYNDTLMVLNVKKLPFDFLENHYTKRIFDIIFSLLICLFVLSWLVPILWVLMKLDSKGPLIFKQKREGINGEQFVCYKFRSMKFNAFPAEIHATKNDKRVTKLGGFLRKTSIDELPQFLNVLQGYMSVVGPRPHLRSLSKDYQKEVDNYIERHQVKPGITGLAQVSGYRGEVKERKDIKNRVRLDIFYIENWSFFLDIKIIFQTVFNVVNGEEKAY